MPFAANLIPQSYRLASQAPGFVLVDDFVCSHPRQKDRMAS